MLFFSKYEFIVVSMLLIWNWISWYWIIDRWWWCINALSSISSAQMPYLSQSLLQILSSWQPIWCSWLRYHINPVKWIARRAYPFSSQSTVTQRLLRTVTTLLRIISFDSITAYHICEYPTIRLILEKFS